MTHSAEKCLVIFVNKDRDSSCYILTMTSWTHESRQVDSSCYYLTMTSLTHESRHVDSSCYYLTMASLTHESRHVDSSCYYLTMTSLTSSSSSLISISDLTNLTIIKRMHTLHPAPHTLHPAATHTRVAAQAVVGLAFRRSHVRCRLSAATLVICSPHCSVQIRGA